MKWPFISRAHHERELLVAQRELAAQCEKRADELHRAWQGMAARANQAELRAMAAEANLRNLAEPVREVAARCSNLTSLALTSGTPRQQIRRVAVVVNVHEQALTPFRGHAPVFAWVVADLAAGAARLLQEQPAPKENQP